MHDCVVVCSQIEELQTKELKLKTLSETQDRTKRMQHIQHDKAKSDLQLVKKKLNRERDLKMDAFQRVDDLQSQVAFRALFTTIIVFDGVLDFLLSLQIYEIEHVLQTMPSTNAISTQRPHTASGSESQCSAFVFEALDYRYIDIPNVRLAVVRSKSRCSSSKQVMGSQRGHTPATWGSGAAPWPANRNQNQNSNQNEPATHTLESAAQAAKRMQRPKTVS